MINIELYISSEEEFLELKNAFERGEIDDTLAIISNDNVSYEFFATESKLVIYECEKNEDGDFQTVDEFIDSEYIEDSNCLEDFVSKIFKIIL